MRHPSESNLFQAAMIWRTTYGLVRVLFGIALLRVVGISFLDLITPLMSHELIQNDSDVLYNFVHHYLTNHPYEVTYFLALYFVFWGTIDIVLSVTMLKHYAWAFPVSMCLIVGFIAYGVFRFAHTHSLILLWIIVVDLIILYLINNERKHAHLRHINLHLLERQETSPLSTEANTQ